MTESRGLSEADRRAAFILRTRRRFLIIFVLIAAGTPIAVAAGLLIGARERPPTVLVLAVNLGALAVIGLTLLLGWRRLRKRLETMPSDAMDPKATRSLLKALRAGEPISPGELSLAGYLVYQQGRQLRFGWILVLAAVLITVGGFFRSGWSGYLQIAFGLIYLGFALANLLNARRIVRAAAAQGIEPDPNGRPAVR